MLLLRRRRGGVTIGKFERLASSGLVPSDLENSFLRDDTLDYVMSTFRNEGFNYELFFSPGRFYQTIKETGPRITLIQKSKDKTWEEIKRDPLFIRHNIV